MPNQAQSMNMMAGFAGEEIAILFAREEQPGESGDADAHGHRKIVSDAPGEAMRIEIGDPRPHQQAEIGPEEAEGNGRKNDCEYDVCHASCLTSLATYAEDSLARGDVATAQLWC